MPISGKNGTKNIKCCRQTGNRGGHFVFCTIKPEMLGHISPEVLGHRPVILLISKTWKNFPKLGKNIQTLEKISKTWKNFPKLGKLSKTWKNFPRLGKNFQELEKIS